MIHNIASCDAEIAPRTEINTRSTKNFNGTCEHCCVCCMLYVWIDRQREIRELTSETAKFKNTVRQVIFPPLVTAVNYDLYSHEEI